MVSDKADLSQLFSPTAVGQPPPDVFLRNGQVMLFGAPASLDDLGGYLTRQQQVMQRTGTMPPGYHQALRLYQHIRNRR